MKGKSHTMATGGKQSGRKIVVGSTSAHKGKQSKYGKNPYSKK